MPRKLWSPFERLLSADMNTYLADQVASIFTDAAARDAAIPTPVLGMPCYLTGLKVHQVWTGAAWANMAWANGLPGAALKSVGTQSIASGAIAKVTILTAVERDTHGYALGSSELTIPAGLGGRYLVTATLDYGASSGAGARYALVTKVTGSVRVAYARADIGAGAPMVMNAVAEATLAAGDKVIAEAGNGSTAASVLATNADYSTKLAIHRIGDT